MRRWARRVEKSGGSAANTIVGVAGFGARAAFVGKVKDDKLGQAFANDIRKAGVAFDTQAREGRPFDRVLLRDGDAGRRAHHEHLARRGAESLSGRRRCRRGRARPRSPISKAICGIRRTPRRRSARPSKIAHDAGRKVALTLSDAFCVGRYRAEFVDLIKTGTVDLVFANESELKSLYETADFDTAVKALRGDARLAVVTRSEKGCVVVSKDGVVAVPAAPIKEMVDATGAGDLFAAGFLFGLARGRDHQTAAQLGALAAAEVIQHIGARPEVSLKELAQKSGLPV